MNFRKRFWFLPILALPFFAASAVQAQLSVTPLGSTAPASLVQSLMGSGVSFSNVTYAGTGASAGFFTGGAPVVGFDSGIILSTGQATGVQGSSGVTSSTCNGVTGDMDLAALSGLPVTDLYDASVLSFDFTPSFNNITFQYVFASEEYNQYVGSLYNDVFGFFLDGTNLALIPGTSLNVSINNVNDCSYSNYFTDNVGSPQGGACTVVKPAAGLATAMNGLTTVLTVSAPVTAGVTYHIKLAVADVGDCRNDSNVFIKANSFVSAFTPTPTSTPTATWTPQPTWTPCGYPGLTCTPTATWTPPPTWTPCGYPGLTCTFTSTWTSPPTWTPTNTSTPTYSPSGTTTPDIRPTATFSPTKTPTLTATHTPTSTATNSPTATPTLTPCGYPGLTCTPTYTPTPTNTIVFTDIFQVSKNVFTHSDPVSIFVMYTPYPGYYQLTVYNSVGEHIKTLDALTMNGPVSFSYLWDGTNKNGEECASGVYLLDLIEPNSRKLKRVLLIH